MSADGPSEAGMSFILRRMKQGAKPAVIQMWFSRVENLNPFLSDGGGLIFPCHRKKIVWEVEIFRLDFNDKFEACKLWLRIEAGTREAEIDGFPHK